MNYQYLNREFLLSDTLGEPIDKDIQKVHNLFIDIKKEAYVTSHDNNKYILFLDSSKYENFVWFYKEKSTYAQFHLSVWNKMLPKFRYLNSKDKKSVIRFFIQDKFNIVSSEDKIVFV